MSAPLSAEQSPDDKPLLKCIPFVNTGFGPQIQLLDIEHPDYLALVDADVAFWSLIKKSRLAEAAIPGPLLAAYLRQADQFNAEMQLLRFGLQPSAVYFNPTERCNLNCTYCYLPEGMRRHGGQMTTQELHLALERLLVFFQRTLPPDRKPQIVFHGAEPLLNREAVFSAIAHFDQMFQFGIQTNATLLDQDAVDFLRQHQVSIGISLDAPLAAVADRTRRTWSGHGVFADVRQALERLRGYARTSVICTITRENLTTLPTLIDLLHHCEVPTCLLNVVRCTLPTAKTVKPDDDEAARYFLAALDHTYERYQATGRKLVVGNFANILLAILAPTARRLMCDISPCGGGRCFFALAANGDLFPCSEFIGLPQFCGGNLFENDLAQALDSPPFRAVKERVVEGFEPCRRCAIRHFCGAPCPAEAFTQDRAMRNPGAFCEFYERQVRYAFRLIAEGTYPAFLWDGWDAELTDA